jgi:FkbM family methyltransferase
VSGEGLTRLRFDYAPFWRPDPRERHPVRVELETFATDDLIATEIREAGTFFEIELLEHLALRGPHGGVFVDVGANIGNHAVFFGRFLADRVVCVEPHPGVVPILRRNLARHGLSASVLPVAAGRTAARAYLSRVKELVHHNVGGCSVEAGPSNSGVEVEVAPLDELLAPLGGRRVTCIKIDVEGLELDVLQGATRILETHRPQLIVELASRDARVAARRFLAEHGYEDIGSRFGWTPTYHFIDPTVHRLRDTPYRPTVDVSAARMRAMQADLSALLAPGSRFILVDQDEIASGLVLDDCTRWPFTERDGQYWGPPADDPAAIRELERLREAGARVIVFARCSFWWLDYYAGFAAYLRHHGEPIMTNERFVAFRLTD